MFWPVLLIHSAQLTLTFNEQIFPIMNMWKHVYFKSLLTKQTKIKPLYLVRAKITKTYNMLWNPSKPQKRKSKTSWIQKLSMMILCCGSSFNLCLGYIINSESINDPTILFLQSVFTTLTYNTWMWKIYFWERACPCIWTGEAWTTLVWGLTPFGIDLCMCPVFPK